MPQINGADLLRQVEAKHPFIHRFIIADRAEMEVLEDGIGSVFHFLPKPCPGNRLIQEIQRCLAIEDWLGKAQIKSVVGMLGELPSLPNLYLKIVDALNSDDFSVELIGKEIAKNLTISTKILKIVSSSYFGFDETISDINQAVSVLGIDTIKNPVLAIQVFGDNREGEIGKATDRLWGHCMTVTQGSKAIMQFETGSAQLAEGAYTAGLFHDIGKLLMLRAAPEDYKVAQEKAQENRVNDWESGSSKTKRVVDWESATSATESRFPTITAKELVDEVTLEEFETVTAIELVAESCSPIRFPKIRATQIYEDLPIPEAQIDSKLVRIDDKVSGAELVDIHSKNVVLRLERNRKATLSNEADYLQRALESTLSIQFTYD